MAGYRLPADHVIHTVGPIWHSGQGGEAELLASCYRRSLEVAEENEVSSVAFPSISTGAFGYPRDAAAEVAIRTVLLYLVEHENGCVQKVVFVVFDQDDELRYQRLLGEMVG